MENDSNSYGPADFLMQIVLIALALLFFLW